MDKHENQHLTDPASGGRDAGGRSRMLKKSEEPQMQGGGGSRNRSVFDIRDDFGGPLRGPRGQSVRSTAGGIERGTTDAADGARSLFQHPAGRLAPAVLAAFLAGGCDAAEAEQPAADIGTQHDRTEGRSRYRQLRYLAEHPERERRLSLAALLPEILLRMSPIKRIELVTTWATSHSPHLRLAIARALRYAPPVPRTPGSLTAIEHLAGDPDPAVRLAIAEAAWLRRQEDPARLHAVLHRLAEDPNRFVSDVARLALGEP